MINLRDLGWKCGNYNPGQTNSIIDVPGVGTGHSTIIEGEGELVPGSGPIRTGVTVVLPHLRNLFREKVPAGVYVANGFGKATGISQIVETGYLESPIAITNTLNVGLVFDALVSHSISEAPEIGIKTGSVSPVVTECFDGYLNDIQGRHVKEHHVKEAIKEAKKPKKPVQGNVGAGTGMQIFELKSGVGTASRIIPKEKIGSEGNFQVGVLVVPNYGKFEDFLFYGSEMLSILDKNKYFPRRKEKNPLGDVGGSIIAIIATNLPFNSRQLTRLAKRGALGIARTGSILGHTSGDFIIAFSTQNIKNHETKDIIKTKSGFDEYTKPLDHINRITIDSIQEAIYNAMLAAEDLSGRDNNIRIALDLSDLPTR